ncbi:MAG: universal stress protein [Muribaculum sp.]|nr:universal stress protein [Muribaculum sp.]
MDTSRLITIAIHTYDKAHQLKNILECEGVKVVLQNVNLSSPVVSSGVRVRIQESDLPLALRVIENIEIFAPSALKECPDEGPVILVPVDFSDYSLKACKIAFQIAELHHATIELIHTYIDPAMTQGAALQLSDSLTFDEGFEAVIYEKEEKTIQKISEKRMQSFIASLKDKIKDGVIPPVKFTTKVTEGLPEEVIDDYALRFHPILIIMGTRGADVKNRELVGSVTAEVLDSCRTPVFTVPESTKFRRLEDLHKVVFFASNQQEDILALDALYRIFPSQSLDLTLVSLPGKKLIVKYDPSLIQLITYCKKNYPAYTFRTASITLSNPIEDFKNIEDKTSIDMIVVPNKKKNLFARLFNPTFAHKLLFHSDIPMMSIPV